jgi:hypothetical protein
MVRRVETGKICDLMLSESLSGRSAARVQLVQGSAERLQVYYKTGRRRGRVRMTGAEGSGFRHSFGLLV